MARGWQALGLVAWVCALVLVLVVFTALGRGALAGPLLTEPATWGAWAGQREPVVVLFAALRLVVLALGWYLLVVSLAGIAARVVRARRLVAVADLVTVPMVRRMLHGALGVSLATSSLSAMGTAALAGEQPPNVVEIHGDGEEADPDWWRITSEDIRGGATSPASEPAPTPDPVPVAAPAEVMAQPPGEPWVTRDARPQAEAEAGGRQVASGRWQVQAGEHFWSIAEQVVGESLGREPSEDEVESYWLALIRENRAGLADPENPDLIYPGQVFTLPAASSASGG